MWCGVGWCVGLVGLCSDTAKENDHSRPFEAESSVPIKVRAFVTANGVVCWRGVWCVWWHGALGAKVRGSHLIDEVCRLHGTRIVGVTSSSS